MEIIEKYVHDKFLEWGIRFVSIVDYADTSVAGNKKARQINGLINEWYLEDLSENIRRTLNQREFDEKNHVKSAVTSKSREGFLGMKE